MLFKACAVVSVLAGAVLGAGVPLTEIKTMGCLSPQPNDKQISGHMQMAAAEAKAGSSMSMAPRADIIVNTYVHVVSAYADANYGYLSRDTVNQQMAVLNQYFKGTGFQYKLADVDWTVNYNWAYNGDNYGMKSALRKGSYKDLNLYYITDIGPNYTNTGFCFYPVGAPRSRDTDITDGCIMSAWTAPGGNSVFSTGRITVHEVGHWHNLIHTFDGNNCGGPGDYVNDTPAEASAASGCDTGRDTCSSPGVDPIHNHMDYSYDTCRTEFTPGQISRMQSSWKAYRAGQ